MSSYQICSFCNGRIIFRKSLSGITIPIHLDNTSCETARFGSQPEFCQQTQCPKCGKSIYFVRHNGGSVWFNELGKPWEKHSCMISTEEAFHQIETFEIFRVRGIKKLLKLNGVVIYIGKNKKRSQEYEIMGISDTPNIFGRWCYLNNERSILKTTTGETFPISRHAWTTLHGNKKYK